MANHASALKRNRQNQRRRLINQMNRRKLKTQFKKLKAAISEGQGEEAQALLGKTLGLIDKSAQKGVIKANTARRHKSRLNRRVNAILA